MTVSAIAAVATNRVIGADNDLAWHLPLDLRFFVRHTKGHALVMGRKTWESMNAPLPKRENIVITRNPDFEAAGGHLASSLQEGLEKAQSLGETEVFVIGGGEIYKQALPLIDRLYYTHVHANVEGDTHFPEVDWAQWRQVFRKDYEADDRHTHAFSTAIYEKIR